MEIGVAASKMGESSPDTSPMILINPMMEINGQQPDQNLKAKDMFKSQTSDLC